MYRPAVVRSPLWTLAASYIHSCHFTLSGHSHEQVFIGIASTPRGLAHCVFLHYPAGVDLGVVRSNPLNWTQKRITSAWLKKTWTNSANKYIFWAIKPLQIAPENAGNRISEAIKLKIFRGSMPPDPPRGYRLRRPFIRTPLLQILDPFHPWNSDGSRRSSAFSFCQGPWSGLAGQRLHLSDYRDSCHSLFQ